MISQIERVPSAYVDDSGNFKVDLVVALSNEIAKKRGINLDNYDSPSVTKEGFVWFVFFEPKTSCLGCHFSVSIDEIELTTMYSPGR